MPYLQEKADGVPVFLLLDQFEVHKSATMRAKLETLGIQLQLIPGGCTGLLQPVDISIGKPFKDCIRKKCFDWTVDQNPELPIITNAFWEDEAAWVADAWRDFDLTIIKNGWQKTSITFKMVV